VDNFDEFEFKPITEGLGFHKKNQKPKLDLSDTLKGKSMPNAPGSRMGQSQFSKVAEEKIAPGADPRSPQPTRPSTRSQTPAQQTNLQRPRQPQYQINQTEFIEEPKATPQSRRQFIKEEISVALPSIFFDSIVIVGLTGLFLFATFLIARVDPINVIKMIPNDPMTAMGVGVLVFSLIQGYLLVSRAFFGSTLGEWAFEIEVGTPEEQMSALYPIRILWRSALTTVTGLILLPLISLALGQDIGGKLSGINLYRG
jgi:hypothetical protein